MQILWTPAENRTLMSLAPLAKKSPCPIGGKEINEDWEQIAREVSAISPTTRTPSGCYVHYRDIENKKLKAMLKTCKKPRQHDAEVELQLPPQPASVPSGVVSVSLKFPRNTFLTLEKKLDDIATITGDRIDVPTACVNVIMRAMGLK